MHVFMIIHAFAFKYIYLYPTKVIPCRCFSSSAITADNHIMVVLDDHVPTAPFGDNVNPNAQPCVDVIEQPTSTQQPRGPNRPHAPGTDIQSGNLFHLVMGR